jgi:hypothetical protein
MGIYKILNSDKSVATASLELADMDAEKAYISSSVENLFIFDDDQDGTGKDIFESYGDTGEYQVIQWVSES